MNIYKDNIATVIIYIKNNINTEKMQIDSNRGYFAN